MWNCAYCYYNCVCVKPFLLTEKAQLNSSVMHDRCQFIADTASYSLGVMKENKLIKILLFLCFKTGTITYSVYRFKAGGILPTAHASPALVSLFFCYSEQKFIHLRILITDLTFCA